MSDLPNFVEINEEGPREGFQIEPGPISTSQKIKLIDALSETGLKNIQVCSFVNPNLVPGWADAEQVVEGFNPSQSIKYSGLYFNDKGLAKLNIGLGKGKKKFDKRETQKMKDWNKTKQRLLKNS